MSDEPPPKDKEEAPVVSEPLKDTDEAYWDEKGGDDPGDGTGEILLDPGIKGLPFDVVQMSKTYGPGQRGAVAPRAYKARDRIMREIACIWVAAPGPRLLADAVEWERKAHEDYGRFFLGTERETHPPYHVCPPQLSPPEFPMGGLHVALTGLLIKHREDIAELVTEQSEWSLHGSLDLLNYPAPQDCYEIARDLYFADKAERWDVKRFGRLFGVLQVNAIRGVLPFSTDAYGVGLFTSAAFFNHACQPNAVIMVYPNTVVIQALSDIELSEEITVAYLELPLELLSSNAIRTLHMRTGAIVNNLGCRCETCRYHLEHEAEVLTASGMDPNGGRDVEVDLKSMFMESTTERLRMDKRLRTFMMAMVQVPAKEEGMLASNGLRMYYDHFLCPPPAEEEEKAPPPPPPPSGEDEEAPDQEEEDKPPPSFCPDLAYMMADIYCRVTLHYPGQDRDNLLFWTALYNELLRRTAVNMPKTLTDALGARCYAALLICSQMDRQDTESLRVVLNIFLEAWLLLRRAHTALYGHRAYLTLICMAYPNIGHLAVTHHELIEHKEMQITMAHAEQVRKEAEEQAKVVALRAQDPEPVAPEDDDMLLSEAALKKVKDFDAMITKELEEAGALTPTTTADL
jgi:hypothetical protein